MKVLLTFLPADEYDPRSDQHSVCVEIPDAAVASLPFQELAQIFLEPAFRRGVELRDAERYR
jgi:hypothetical protein